jgi:hypothetical protein
MKAQEDDLLVYDEDDAVKFILNSISKEDLGSIDETKIEYVLDVVYEYYEENGLIDEDSTEEASIDEEQMAEFILKCATKDNISLTQDELQLILDGEFEYGRSLGIYENEE